jgi:hypothetical protein
MIEPPKSHAADEQDNSKQPNWRSILAIGCYSMPSRRGNPTWDSGGPARLAPAVATEFEVQVRKLRLTKQTCAGSRELRIWCERNRNRCYIPEWLLNEWGIPVDPNSGG